MKKLIFKAIVVVFIIIITVFPVTSCQQKQKIVPTDNKVTMFPIAITDVFGSTITIEKKPERIVALAPSTVEVLYRLGLGDKIVGVTDYCDYPLEAKDKPKVGNFNGYNIEKILEAKPDIILAGTGIPKDIYQKLIDLKMKVVVTEASSIAQIPESFMIIGSATGEVEKAKKLCDDVNARMNEVINKVKSASKVKSYYVISFGKEGNWTGGKGTFISDLINMAGGENIADDVNEWKDYSIEKIVEKNPSVIMVSAMIANDNKDILNNEKGYKETNAVKNHKTIIVDDNLTQRPGPRIVEGLEVIAKAIHPEIFNK